MVCTVGCLVVHCQCIFTTCAPLVPLPHTVIISPVGSVNTPSPPQRPLSTSPPSNHLWADSPSPRGDDHPRSRVRNTCPETHRRAYRPTSPTIVAFCGDSGVNSFTVSYTLPKPSQGLGLRQKYSEEREPREVERKVLVFHGMILRSQLVTLLKNGIFFKEESGVSLTWWCAALATVTVLLYTDTMVLTFCRSKFARIADFLLTIFRKLAVVGKSLTDFVEQNNS